LISDISVAEEPVSNSNITAQQIIDELDEDITVFLDFDSTRVLDSNFQSKNAVGDSFYYINSAFNSSAAFAVAYGTHLLLSDFNGNGMLSFTGASSWQSTVDNAINDWNSANSLTNDATLVTCFKLGGNAYTHLIATELFNIFYMNGSLQFKDVNGTNTVVPNFQVVPLTAYMLKIERHHNTSTFEWEITNLESAAVQTATTDCGNSVSGNLVSCRFGWAATNFTHHQSYVFLYDNRTSARNTMIYNFCKQQYGSEVAAVPEITPVVHSEDIFFEMRVR